MCNWITEGTKFGCGHYAITRKVEKIDCGSRRCIHSQEHRRPCPGCTCERYYGPDLEERVTRTTSEYCQHCDFWYNKGGQR